MFPRTSGSCAVGQLRRKAQWAIVEYLTVLETVRKHQLPVFQQSGSTTPEARSDAVNIHALPVVMMERGVNVNVVSFFGLACTLQGVSQMHAPHVLAVTLLYNKFWRILHPDIGTKRSLTRPLECRTVEAVDATVVLPCQVVKTVGVDPAEHMT